MTGTDLIIFDCDGVLVDSEPVANRVMAANLTRHGLAMTTERAIALFVGSSMRDAMTKAQELGAALPDDWIDEIYAETNAALAEGVAAIPGIVHVLDWAEARGLAYCVASNGSAAKMDITLGLTGLAPRFAGRRFSAHELGVAKPDPGLFLHAAEACGAAPERCLVVEDSASGAEAASRAGMACLGYAPHGDGAALRRFGAAIIADMSEIPAVLAAR